MKIRTRDIGLLTVGFVLGTIITVSFTLGTPRPVVMPSSKVITSGPLFAALSFPPVVDTNFVIQLPPIDWGIPNASGGLNLQVPSFKSGPQSLDLIDMRYQPDIRLDDLK